MIARAFWLELNSSSVDELAVSEAKRIYDYSIEVMPRLPAKTRSISLAAIKNTWLLANYFRPSVVAEVGTYIGRSTLALAWGARESLKSLFTSDITFDCREPPKNQTEKISCFGKTSSRDIFRMLSGKRKIDMFLIDGRLQDEDLNLIESLCHERSIFLIDDFEGVEKGVESVIRLRAKFSNLMLLAPSDSFSSGWGNSHCMAVLVPSPIVQLSRQQRLPLWMM